MDRFARLGSMRVTNWKASCCANRAPRDDEGYADREPRITKKPSPDLVVEHVQEHWEDQGATRILLQDKEKKMKECKDRVPSISHGLSIQCHHSRYLYGARQDEATHPTPFSRTNPPDHELRLLPRQAAQANSKKQFPTTNYRSALSWRHARRA